MQPVKYNGWANYETWVTVLWIDNEYSTYKHRIELTEQVKAEYPEDKRIRQLEIALKDWIEESNPIVGEASLYSDLLGAAISEIDWNEIAKHYLAE